MKSFKEVKDKIEKENERIESIRLMRKNRKGQRHKSVSLGYKNDFIYKTVVEIAAKTGKTIPGVVKDAILYYKVFVDKAIE